MSHLTPAQIGERLRAARQAAGLSLAQVEEKSLGHWKAVVVGSYERAQRAVTVPRMDALLRFYGRGDRLEILGPGDVVTPAAEGAEGGTEIEYGVRLADGSVVTVADEAAAVLIERVAAASVVRRVVRRTEWSADV
ncbi:MULTISPECIES: helix-turn-helix domain-containing protein [Catenuloplanes]|uniref:Transcriptional regulator with XRE-family HTH domain n=1 Tax=Catenuloplanes niger TaxID=587534 RepID=A0AAE3ZNY7_9ACTN|nr:transcriptional regulator with XRE-family HTH domain [Catenuloplanes niger]